VALFLSALKARMRPQPTAVTPDMAARYAEFAAEDRDLANQGMADYTQLLHREDR
jgi:hypothetical protein